MTTFRTSARVDTRHRLSYYVHLYFYDRIGTDDGFSELLHEVAQLHFGKPVGGNTVTVWVRRYLHPNLLGDVA